MARSADINSELFLEFVDESIDSLQSIENLLLELEKQPENNDLVQAIFRPVHSLKGNAAYFGLMSVKLLAHKMENLLDGVRKKTIAATNEIINLLLPGLDLLKKMLEAERKGYDSEEYIMRCQKIIGDIDTVFSKSGSTEEMLRNIITEIEKIVDTALFEDKTQAQSETLLLIKNKTEAAHREFNKNSKNDPEAIPEEFKRVQNLLEKRFENYATPDQILEIQNALNLLNTLSDNPSYLQSVSEIQSVLEVYLGAGIEVDNITRELMLDKTKETIEKYYNIFIKTPVEEKEDTKHDQEEAKKYTSKTTEKKTEKTLRIAQSSLDDFLDKIGELLEVEEIFRYQINNINEDTLLLDFVTNFRQSVYQLSQTTQMLLGSLMEIRKVESSVLLKKAQRIVRDISDSAGKKITLRLIGEEVPIDKSYIDMLDAPLTHMVRNAADHGIEKPQQRKESGKNDAGSITLEMSVTDENVIFSVSDDGRGINFDEIKNKAVSMGICGEHEVLSRNDLIEVLFTSGVSTAEKITDVSGRGVGMDVVKRSIESAGGEITISSEIGQGTTFKIILPANVNTKIMEGCIIKSSKGNTYIIPMKNVEESFPDYVDNVTHTPEGGPVLNRRGTLYPLVSIEDVLQKRSTQKFSNEKKMQPFIMVKGEASNYILWVDAVVGVQKIVVKPLSTVSEQRNLFEGAAVLGDGSVGLILNSEQVIMNAKV